MALLALSCICDHLKKIYLNEIAEIIRYHQEHRNLTHLAYQSAWQFIMSRLFESENLEPLMNELHFVEEATREMEELIKQVEWKTNEFEMKETKEYYVAKRWLCTIEKSYELRNVRSSGSAELVACVIKLHNKANGYNGTISDICTKVIGKMALSRAVDMEDILKGGVADMLLEINNQSSLDVCSIYRSLSVLVSLLGRFHGMKLDESAEAKRKEEKKMLIDKIEEDGFEENIVSFLKISFYGVIQSARAILSSFSVC
ncbi:uncharacterized protein MONOS_14803 [Monocercomonoides exilis]|uniref:uncharacterized protein n=1 Tax=Monocercomonoides exilis TaxID=2049356 RepID=UPI003559F74C|nr:hypothetical protein MONOS_14803 [Monocercomonoides exilis]|eukprot:MONOS_14803.1-p1 / transcript=MONOS_14803.1 / gene=MONOS_14803 / organism=Monocercomonoides_exilis_PA203 / gene_product=unspecified product / transcript_product=unspecified product / location=Mono_scaffold01076:17113-17948(-) / protein_length=258 / sequence_SO=supercontig / SO=protein_coding / is_pseudo=false